MKKKTYLIILYISLAVFVLGIALLIEECIRTQTLNVWASIGLALSILSIANIVFDQCIYRVKKVEFLKTISQTKNCPNCNCVNDADAEYCKMCGTKFKNF